MEDAIFQVDARDSVATALRDIAAGEVVREIYVQDAIPKGHKIALRPIDRGDATIANIASGARTAAERNGEREIGISKRGVTL